MTDLHESETTPSADVAPQASRRSSLVYLCALWGLAATPLAACGGGTVVAVVPGGGGTGDVPPSFPELPPPPAMTTGTAPSTAPASGQVSLAWGGQVWSVGGLGVVESVDPLDISGMRFDLAADFELSASSTSSTALARGMVVNFSGTLPPTPGRGRLNSVSMIPQLRGVVSGANPDGFTIGGVSAMVQAATTYENVSASGWRDGDAIEAFGLLEPGNTEGTPAILRATRVIKLNADNGVRVVSGSAQGGSVINLRVGSVSLPALAFLRNTRNEAVSAGQLVTVEHAGPTGLVIGQIAGAWPSRILVMEGYLERAGRIDAIEHLRLNSRLFAVASPAAASATSALIGQRVRLVAYDMSTIQGTALVQFISIQRYG